MELTLGLLYSIIRTLAAVLRLLVFFLILLAMIPTGFYISANYNVKQYGPIGGFFSTLLFWAFIPPVIAIVSLMGTAYEIVSCLASPFVGLYLGLNGDKDKIDTGVKHAVMQLAWIKNDKRDLLRGIISWITADRLGKQCAEDNDVDINPNQSNK
jgi:hypothetical protein